MLSEGLRLGAVPFTARYCTKDWKVPGDGFVIPKDMKVIIPTVSTAPRLTRLLLFIINVHRLDSTMTQNTGLSLTSLILTGLALRTRARLRGLLINLLGLVQGRES